MTYSATVTEVQYVGHGSDKFYRAYVMHDPDTDDCRVLFNWGRNGAKGQFQSVGAPTVDSGRNAARGKLDSKLAKGYEFGSTRNLGVVPDDLLELAGVGENARSAATARLAIDPFAAFAAGTDRLIRLVTGPIAQQAEAVTLRNSLTDQLSELQNRLLQAEGSLELATDVLAMKLDA